MSASLVVVRTCVLIMFLLILLSSFYVLHVSRLATDAAAQSAADAAVQAATAAGWDCEAQVPQQAQKAAAHALLSQIEHLAVQPVGLTVYADACNLTASVTTTPLNIRLGTLAVTAAACRSVARTVTLNVPGPC